MRKLVLIAFLALAASISIPLAAADTAPPTAGGMYPQVGVSPTPIIVNQAAPAAAVAAPTGGGGVINIGQAFGTILQPYIDALVQALIVSAVGWLAWLVKNKLGVDVDAKQRDALQAFLLNTANSLIAAGAVKMQGTTVTVRSEALSAEVNTAISRIPDALKHFGLDAPTAAGILKDKILDAIPQTTAGAEIITQAHAANGNGHAAEPPAPVGAPAVPIPPPLAPAPGVTSAAEPQVTAASETSAHPAAAQTG